MVGPRAYNIRVHSQTFHSDRIRSSPPRPVLPSVRLELRSSTWTRFESEWRIVVCTLKGNIDPLIIFLLYLQVSGTGGEGGTHVYREKRAWQEHYRSSPRQPESASLEHMLGSLRADMSRQGVQTPQKGCCNACEKPIVGQVDDLLRRFG